MKNTIFALTIAFGLTVNASSLGELRGIGTVTASYDQFNGKKTVRKYENCRISMNLKRSATSLTMDFAAIECLATNDFFGTYYVKGNKLVDEKGKVKGQVLADGTFQVSEKSSRLIKGTMTEYEFGGGFPPMPGSPENGGNFPDPRNPHRCVPVVRKNNVELIKVVTYKIKQLEDRTWKVQRSTSEDQLAWGSKAGRGGCPGTSFKTKLGSTTDLNVILK
ncbi:hypothetical protein B9G69_017290 [Bdellovibrio sp. SKB1291214]|uniref:hypothetical protein n=1 Tax=Bdellovibrio sp. SKB1291214 TaxID=1732569 RepID=UPI000B514D8C|nr:hypothetical protein [Bdellovibrio sp. SKB1291214]UYL08800.1 hypothetical protein B9G69_017290 [Bdellovibrio sp. SKB1291214]